MQSTFKKIAIVGVLLGPVGCGTPQSDPTPKVQTTTAAPTFAAESTQIQLTDGVYKGMLFGKRVTLRIQDGQLVEYFWEGRGGYEGKTFSREGNIQKINKYATVVYRSATSERIDGRYSERGAGPLIVFRQ